MLAARNKRFRIAAALGALAYLILAIRYVIDADHVFRDSVPGGYVVAVTILVAVHLVGICGFLMVAGAFGDELDWRRLRIGGAILVVTLFGEFAAWVFYLIPTVDHVHFSDFRNSYRWTTAGALLVAAGVGIVVTGFADSRRGSSRAHRLWLGAILVTAGYLAATGAQLYLQSFYSSLHAVHEVTIGMLAQAVGTFGIALAGTVFVVAARRPLVRREAAVTGSAAAASLGALCLAGGTTLVAIAYGTYASVTWQTVVAWLQAGSTFIVAASFVALALGARTVK